MNYQDIYNNTYQQESIWNYYEKDFSSLSFSDSDSCYAFIKIFIEYSGKYGIHLYQDLDYVKDTQPLRLLHIISTFFLGLWLYRKNDNYLHNNIHNELKKLRCFDNNTYNIDKQFTYVWFMATLFHDLAYKYEEKNNGESLPRHKIPCKQSIPNFYKKVYNKYYRYRRKKEHGIYAGLTFDKEISEIRRFHDENNVETKGWEKKLEEIYHYVAWIILAHNIWLKREGKDNTKHYRKRHLGKLIQDSTKDTNGHYKEYKVKFKNYPLLTFFCIIDTIEPRKANINLSETDISLFQDKIIIQTTNDSYRKKIKGLNDWLLPVTEKGDKLMLHLNY